MVFKCLARASIRHGRTTGIDAHEALSNEAFAEPILRVGEADHGMQPITAHHAFTTRVDFKGFRPEPFESHLSGAFPPGNDFVQRETTEVGGLVSESAGESGALLTGVDEIETERVHRVPMLDAKAITVISPILDQADSGEDLERSFLAVVADGGVCLVPPNDDPDRCRHEHERL